MCCNNCGNMNVDGAKFCESCGAALESVAQQQNTGDTGVKVSNTEAKISNTGNTSDIL